MTRLGERSFVGPEQLTGDPKLEGWSRLSPPAIALATARISG
jgi:hypothetical protein